MKLIECYKVVYPIDGKLVSANQVFTKGLGLFQEKKYLPLRVEYKPYVFSFPNDNRFPLYAFESKDDVINWTINMYADNVQQLKLYKCIAIESDKPIRIARFFSEFRLLLDGSHSVVIHEPQGTIPCDAICILEEEQL